MRQSGARIFRNKRIYYLLVLKFKGKNVVGCDTAK